MSQPNSLSLTQENVNPQVYKYIGEWKSRLMDLSKRNRLLYFKHSPQSNLSIAHPDVETVFNKLVVRKRHLQFWMPPEERGSLPEKLEQVGYSVLSKPEPSRPLSNQIVSEGLNRKDLERILKKFHRRSLSDYRERGIRILHAAFGMLIWKDAITKEEVHSPLIIVPIELSRESIAKPFTVSVPSVEEVAIVNPALQVKLKTDFKIDLPPLPENGDNRSLTEYFNSVSQIVQPFGWKVENSLEVGLFSFHKQVIHKDLEDNVETIIQHPIIRAVAGIKDTKLVLDSLPEEKDIDKIEDPEKVFQVLDADSSQRISIEYALHGQSFVMQGPPGTGKSQTIANIISESIAHGKSVLFVSDKMAALEVVYKRLKDVGLSSFCLELHSSKANKQKVVAELKRCLGEHVVPQKIPISDDYKKIAEFRDRLNGYILSLHRKHPVFEVTPFEVLGELASLEGIPSIPVGLENICSLNPQRMRELENLMSDLSRVWRVMDEEFLWFGYRGNDYSLDVCSELSSFLEGLILQINRLKTEAAETTGRLGLKEPSTFDDIQWLIELDRMLKESPRPEASWVTHPDIGKLRNESQACQRFCEWRHTTRQYLKESYNDDIYSLPMNKSTEIEEALSPIRDTLVPESIEEGELLKKRLQVLDFVKNLQSLAENWSKNATELSQLFGLPAETLTIEYIEQLSNLALLCFSEDKPEVIWFNHSHLQSLKEILPKAKKDIQEINSLQNKIEKIYTNDFYRLDLDRLVMQYNGPYRGIGKWINPSYYSDQKQIALVTHEGRVPQSILKDLIDARRVRLLKEEIRSYEKLLQQLLGHFYQGLNTNFEDVEKAIEKMLEICRLLRTNVVPKNIARIACHEISPQFEVQQLPIELKESVQEWRRANEQLSSIIPTRMANSKILMTKTSLVEVQEWANETERQLSSLFGTINNVLNVITREPQNFKQFLNDLRMAEELRKKEAKFLRDEALFQTKFGVRFRGFKTDWTQIIRIIDWTKKLQAMFESTEIPTLLVTIVSARPEDSPSTENLILLRDEVLRNITSFESRFEPDLSQNNRSLQQAMLGSIHSRITAFRNNVDDLQIWFDFKRIRERYQLSGLGPFFARLTQNPPLASQLVDVFRKGVLQEWISNYYLEDETLGRFRREKHEHLIADFKKLDQELIHLSANMVIQAANDRKPQDIVVQAADSEIGVLLRESAKKKRLMPIRALLQRIPNLLPRLKPCLLMSPISVSQFLTAETKFDLVLFDEASQIVPEDAVGAIYRGKTIVVAGDNKQLPPTSFFQKSLIDDGDWDETDEDDVEVFDSILDECVGVGLPIKTLTWHYRSRHESLIAYSNKSFYNGSLITFPAAKAEHETLGVKLIHVRYGLYDRGGKRDNLKEAEAVTDLVFEHFHNYPTKTLGVVTFSVAQMEAIEEAIEHRLQEHPEYEHFFKEDRLEGFFVKNLENVQGDERDVMIFSVGYGRDQQGKMTLNFGPLNKSGGERRLNVAVTRAREKIILVTSIKASDINTNSNRAEGVVALRNYLEYAESKYQALQSNQPSIKFKSKLEEDLEEEIRNMNYSTIAKVGCGSYPIDIGVADPTLPGSYVLGIECDGKTYRASNSARDRDRLREQVLGQLGWKIHRVWSPDWVARRDSEVKRLKNAIEAACKANSENKHLQPSEDIEKSDPKPKVEIKQLQFQGTEKIGDHYKVHVLRPVVEPYVEVPISKYPYTSRQKNKFHFPQNRILQSRLLEELVLNEGPINFDYAVHRLANSWGLKRVGPKVVDAVKEALELLIKDHRLIVKEKFLWPNNLTKVQVRVPTPDNRESMRIPEHIPSEEIEMAMLSIVKYALSISADSLIEETIKIFGFNYVNEKTRQRFSEVYEKLLQKKKLIFTNDAIRLA